MLPIPRACRRSCRCRCCAAHCFHRSGLSLPMAVTPSACVLRKTLSCDVMLRGGGGCCQEVSHRQLPERLHWTLRFRRGNSSNGAAIASCSARVMSSGSKSSCVASAAGLASWRPTPSAAGLAPLTDTLSPSPFQPSHHGGYEHGDYGQYGHLNQVMVLL